MVVDYSTFRTKSNYIHGLRVLDQGAQVGHLAFLATGLDSPKL